MDSEEVVVEEEDSEVRLVVVVVSEDQGVVGTAEGEVEDMGVAVVDLLEDQQVAGWEDTVDRLVDQEGMEVDSVVVVEEEEEDMEVVHLLSEVAIEICQHGEAGHCTCMVYHIQPRQMQTARLGSIQADTAEKRNERASTGARRRRTR